MTGDQRIDSQLETIAVQNPTLRACNLVRTATATEARRHCQDTQILDLPLAGSTVAVKDNIDVATTVRSDGLGPPFPPPAARDALAVARLRAAGAIVIAKTNLEELSLGATTQNAWWGSCRNPYDLGRIPGGSSGGSAVAVASGMSDFALGTDTGGSIRNPAAYCGVTGLRPTHGLVPTHGVTAVSPAFDVCGPMARSARELRAVLHVLIGRRPSAPPRSLLPGLRVGVPENFFYDDLDVRVGQGADALLNLLVRAKAVVRPLHLYGAEQTVAVLQTLLNSDAARQLGRYIDDRRVCSGVRKRLSLGASTTSDGLRTADRAAAGWRAEIDRAWLEVDVILTPTVPRPAPTVGGDLVTLSRDINRLNCAWSLVGSPAMTFPVGHADLPVGAQLIAPREKDVELIDIVSEIQVLSSWHHIRPKESVQ